uniref:Uncharacterized protein n=1 Tax=Arundo donax TaxID=35708 RepID=A0A0A9GMS2_ARUDO
MSIVSALRTSSNAAAFSDAAKHVLLMAARDLFSTKKTT